MSDSIIKIDGFDEEVNKIDSSKKQRISFTIFQEDWIDMLRFKNYKIITDEDLSFSLNSVILYGLELLKDKYTIKRGCKKIALKTGRGSHKKKVKYSSVELPMEQIEFMNDFYFHKIMIEGKLDYNRFDLFHEMTELIRKNNPKAFT